MSWVSLGARVQPLDLMVLAGGFGTRLRAAVPDVPKALAPVVDQPFLGYQIDNWIAQGVSTITFLLYYGAGLTEAFLASLRAAGRLSGCEVRIVTEPRPLGTGGAIAHAVEQLRIAGSFLVTNADTWLGSGIRQLSESPAPAMAVLEVAGAERYGLVRLQPGGKIIGFEEKPDGTGSGWINAGLYHLHASLFQDWEGAPFSLERELFPALASAGRLTGVQIEAGFIDIGVPADYFRFCRWVDSGRAGVP
jgi:D-glycero-alpha-D-manno-heptose 1-phosphate guanylyltransferase